VGSTKGDIGCDFSLDEEEKEGGKGRGMKKRYSSHAEAKVVEEKPLRGRRENWSP